MEKKKNILYISERIWRLGLFVLGMMTVMFAFAFFWRNKGKKSDMACGIFRSSRACLFSDRMVLDHKTIS